MRENSNQHIGCRRSFQRPNKEDSFDKTLVRIILQNMNPEMRQGFLLRLQNDYAPDIQVKLYAFVKAMICAWAGGDDLSQEDAEVIEDCRKICDVMGWPPNRRLV